MTPQQLREKGEITDVQFEVMMFIQANDEGKGVSQLDLREKLCNGNVEQFRIYQPRFRELEQAGLIRSPGQKRHPIHSRRKAKAYVLADVSSSVDLTAVRDWVWENLGAMQLLRRDQFNELWKDQF